jgi:ATP-dependent helicase/nuclease subunit A
MKYPLNQQQAKAVAEFDTDLLVTAGAGTGKTSVLTNKYLRLLEERRANVGEIVAITFTKKAAAEMRTRIQQEIQAHVQEAVSAVEDVFWKTQLLAIENARISTFHSFCLGLLHDYPLEIGIAPVTGILGDGEETIYLNQAIEQSLLESFTDSPVDRQILTRMALDFGWNGFINSLANIYRRVRESGNNFDRVIHDSIVYLQEAIRGVPYEFSHLIEEIDDFLSFCQTVRLTEKAAAVIGVFRSEWQGQQLVLKENSTADMVLTTLIRIKKGLPKTVPNTIKERVVAMHELIDSISRKLLDQEALQRTSIIGYLFNRMDTVYSGLKKELGLMDFTDQIRLVRDLLLNRQDILAQVRQDIHYLLVDEFQDTNSLQLEIVDLLVGTSHTKGRLMAVGDIKQSIYRFRGAEAGLIQGLAERMQAGNGSIIPLTRNYRSNPAIIHFVNSFFAGLFSGDIFHYEPLEAASGEQGENIEFLLTGSVDKEAEARMVAERIRTLVSADENLKYGDIVILFRASTAMHLYQQALQKLAIPYYTASGGGFYHRPEVVDQLNLLRLVEQRYNGVALLGLLNSPYVSLSSESLLWLSEGRDLLEQFYGREEFAEQIAGDEKLRLQQFRKLILDLQKNREYLNIANIIRIALQNSNYREVLWGLPHAGQRLANLDKLLEKADEFTGKGFSDLRRFLEFIEKLEEVEVIEGEAQIQAETSDAVRLMTIHRAKGLEFPVVILPDLDRQFPINSQGRMTFHKSAGVGLAISFGDNENAPSSLWEFIKEQDRKEELSELKRVLYVALTRAKQQLIMVGSGCNRSKGKSIETANNWMKWFELLIPLDTTELSLDYRGSRIRITRNLPPLDEPAPCSSFLADNIAALPEIVMLNSEGEQESAAAGLLSGRTIKTFKVTELLVFKDCARRYFWEYRWGLTDAMRAEPSTYEGSGTGGNLGAKIGSFLHQIIQAAGTQWPDTLWQKTFEDMAASESRGLKADLQQMWQNFRQSRFTQESGKCWDEVPFILKLNDNQRVEGRFDRLIQTDDGGLTLVDYKSHRIQAGEVVIKAKPYFWQLQLYALAIKALWGRLPDRAALYFLYPNETVTVPLDEESLSRTSRDVQKIMQFIEEHHNWRDYPKGERCEYCEYRSICGTGQEIR